MNEMLKVLMVMMVMGVGLVDAGRRPHLVTFMIDDVGWSDLGFRNGSSMLTPNLDAAMRTGVNLDRFYAQPVCSPSRAAFLQGRYPFRTGLQHFTTIQPASPAHMPLDIPTLAETLGSVGYDAHAIGKWHVGYASFDYTPTKRGFLSHTGYFQGEIDYYTKNFTVPSSFVGALNLTGYDWWQNVSVARTAVDATTYSQDLMMTELERVLSAYNQSGHANSDQPLFLFFANQIVHVPLDSPGEEYVQRCLDAGMPGSQDPLRLTYCAMMLKLDDNLGQLIGLLKDYGMWDDTLLLVSTDNGGDPPSGSFPPSAGCNWPLRAGKGTVFEGGVRSVCFFNGGANVFPEARRGSTIEGLAHIVDWFPTMLSLANVSAALFPEGLDGFDLTPALFQGLPLSRDSIPLNIDFNISFPPDWGHQVSVLSSDGWKLIRQKVHGHVMNYDGYFPCLPAQKIAANTTESGNYLFNVLDDPAEHNNLYDSLPDQVSRLDQILDSYVKSGYRHSQFNSFDPLGAPQLHDGVWAPYLKQASN